MPDDTEQILAQQMGGRRARQEMRRRYERTARARAEARPNPATNEQMVPMFTPQLEGRPSLGLQGMWQRLVGDSLRAPYIGDPSGGGRNVAGDYMAGGRYSSQRGIGDTRSVTQPSNTPSLTGAFSRVLPGRPQPASPLTGMPPNLARAAQTNLAAADRQINRFNFSSQLASRAATAPAVRLSAPSSFDRFAGFTTTRGNYTQSGSNLYSAYHSVLAIPPPKPQQ